jgi:hypothetical protein
LTLPECLVLKWELSSWRFRLEKDTQDAGKAKELDIER